MMQVKAKELRVEEAERRLEQRERDAQDALAAAEEVRGAEVICYPQCISSGAKSVS